MSMDHGSEAVKQLFIYKQEANSLPKVFYRSSVVSNNLDNDSQQRTWCQGKEASHKKVL